MDDTWYYPDTFVIPQMHNVYAADQRQLRCVYENCISKCALQKYRRVDIGCEKISAGAQVFRLRFREFSLYEMGRFVSYTRE
jgi:hypothetical protein